MAEMYHADGTLCDSGSRCTGGKFHECLEGGGPIAPWPPGIAISEDEQAAMDAAVALANAMRKVIGEGPVANHDWNEVARSIHDIQARIVLNAVGRQTDICRPLGG